MNKNVLEKEINLIQDLLIRDWTRATLQNAPDYFFIAQASSTGKYHPACTCKEGGLIVHVQRAVYIANRLCEGWGIFKLDRDIVLSATILHDIAKTPSHDPKYTYADFENHPINARKYFDNTTELNKEPNKTTIELINNCIKYHMGRWTPASIKKDITNYSLSELCVYTSDYIATTKDLITPEDKEIKNG